MADPFAGSARGHSARAMQRRAPRRRPRPAWLAAPALALALAGCASFVPQDGPEPEPQPPARYVELTRPVIAMGDTQEHESTGYPMHDNDSSVDAYVEVAQRPPEHPLFGRRILEWALKSHPDEPFLHLGDVMDLSCRSEAIRMTRIFRDAGRMGAILPGNHDGLMFGIYGYKILDTVLDEDARHWNLACRRGAALDDKRRKTTNEAFSKRDFISTYLDEYARLPGAAPGLQSTPPSGDYRVSWRNPDARSFLSAIEAQLLDGYAYADSFITQRLKLPAAPGATREVILIALDTNQAGVLVGTWDTIMGRSPGSRGHVKADQIGVVTRWVLEAARNGDIVVFAGHHNWNSLSLPTRVRLRNLMSNLAHPLVYLSAHTHRGFWAVHRALDRRPLLELNVSSLSDWPIAYRRISFAYDEQANRLRVRGDILPGGDAPVASDADLLANWVRQACDPIGPKSRDMANIDRELVVRQRASRGSIFDWVVSALGPVCETCEQPLYDHAHAYLDTMLEAILQLGEDLGAEVHQLHTLALPEWCGKGDFVACGRALQGTRPQGFSTHVELFRRKAMLVDLLSTHLDDLKSPHAASYMTCRAVQAAKIDFDLTDESRNNFRSEANRRAEQFFRIEASVGMD
jgi:hypothetical protein